jgi:hypothetical protein
MAYHAAILRQTIENFFPDMNLRPLPRTYMLARNSVRSTAEVSSRSGQERFGPDSQAVSPGNQALLPCHLGPGE